jgi:hypothetical protein
LRIASLYALTWVIRSLFRWVIVWNSLPAFRILTDLLELNSSTEYPKFLVPGSKDRRVTVFDANTFILGVGLLLIHSKIWE